MLDYCSYISRFCQTSIIRLYFPTALSLQKTYNSWEDVCAEETLSNAFITVSLDHSAQSPLNLHQSLCSLHLA